MSVQVAVRVRPFNTRESEMGSKLCVQMDGNQTTLINFDDPKKNRSFAFDFSFWSHDEFEITPDGLNVPMGDKYADQRKVYELVGTQILTNAWQGYNCCLFAYGQTGAGKSYSMVGYKPNVGIVPIACEQIFKKIQENDNQNLNYEVTVSMCEIYMEKVQDLLIPTNKRPPGGLNVRQSKTLGFYVENITQHPVVSFEEIENYMEQGSKNRTIASTLMNASSSRAHTLITIEFKQVQVKAGKQYQKFSIINLVDLAGSEKVGKTGATGDRLQQAGQINKSLSTLGLVIERLADQASSKQKVQVPYRDSQLTKILSNALGGNSKTLMICALSPAWDNFQETLSTLRYADQAQKIKNEAKVNESATDKVIRELNQENDRLKKLMEQFLKFKNDPSFRMANQEDEQTTKEQLEADYNANKNLMNEYSVSYKDKLVNEKKLRDQEQETQIDMSQPYLTNLNEDPLLNGKVTYSLSGEETRVGRQNGNPTPSIILGGMGIKPNHAIFINQDEKITLNSLDTEASDFIYVNGDKLGENGLELFHRDRLIFGTNSIFLFIHPNGKEREEYSGILNIDYEFAEDEKSQKAEQLQQQQEQELEQEAQRLKDIENKVREEQLQKEKEEISRQMEQKFREMEEQFKKKQLELEERMLIEGQKQKAEKEKADAEQKLVEQKAQIENEQFQQEKQLELEQKKMQDDETKKKNQIQEKHYLENKLTKCLPQILEVNLIAKELKRNVTLEPKLSYTYSDSDDLQLNAASAAQSSSANSDENNQQRKIQIIVKNNEQGLVYHWDLVKFSNRYYMIKEMLQKFFETNEYPKVNDQDDPFWDPPEPHLVGISYLKLFSLSMYLDLPSEITIVGDSGLCGSLRVNLIPTDETGKKNLSQEIENNQDQDSYDDPQQILNQRLDFRVVIESAQLPQTCCSRSFVEYNLMKNDYEFEKFSTSIQIPKNPRPNFNYDYHHYYPVVTQALFNYICNGTICFKVYGEQILNSSNQIGNLTPVEDQIEKKSKQTQQEEKNLSNVNQDNQNFVRKASIKDDSTIQNKSNENFIRTNNLASDGQQSNNQTSNASTRQNNFDTVPQTRNNRHQSVQNPPNQFTIHNKVRNDLSELEKQKREKEELEKQKDDGCLIF